MVGDFLTSKEKIYRFEFDKFDKKKKSSEL